MNNKISTRVTKPANYNHLDKEPLKKKSNPEWLHPKATFKEVVKGILKGSNVNTATKDDYDFLTNLGIVHEQYLQTAKNNEVVEKVQRKIGIINDFKMQLGINLKREEETIAQHICQVTSENNIPDLFSEAINTESVEDFDIDTFLEEVLNPDAFKKI
ncbi:MAG: hypothetical protein CO175_08245 [Verrucomicrobia bacterium CG_4_9_14_3_um_filter_43_20]|nr:MAG: hypothetical protein AUJ82_03050 [Verrucomicrobia bacterium CG1_02_43_26]PIP59117.1 MAG: hypothetical protein COX01_05275 [Verrucomicrobia bacterium CG22_combo_CG10-13_8_21_14_all_43_17]PJA43405.1 MAG: hypothetical protein CO175_08245 [Verrucomicrobia bacterium CG_4_9_14_3_um_filter_43_20]